MKAIYFRPFIEVIVITPFITRPRAHLAWFGCGIFVLQKLRAESARRFVEIESDGLVVEDVGIPSQTKQPRCAHLGSSDHPVAM